MEAKSVQSIDSDLSGSLIRRTTNVDKILYFVTSEEQEPGLWRTDGTPAGTSLIRAFEKLPDNFQEYLAVDDKLYFVNFENDTGNELWISDGTKEGTSIVKDVFDNGSSYPTQLTEVADEVYFLANSDGGIDEELWVTDGTEEGTRIAIEGDFDDTLDEIEDVRGALYYTQRESSGSELWRLDAESGDAERILENSGSDRVQNLTRVGEALYFSRNGSELWKVEDDASDPELLVDFAPDTSNQTIENLTAVGNTLYFSFNDLEIGRELYKSNGEANNTGLVQDISPDRQDAGRTINLGSEPSSLTNVNGTLYFVADSDDDNQDELWKTRGTEASTERLAEFRFNQDIDNLIDVSGTVYFGVRDTSDDTEIWRSDGTEEGTTLATDVIGERFDEAEAVNGDLYFLSEEELVEREIPKERLWILDNTPEVTRLFDPDTRANVYTADEDEIEDLIDDGYDDRGIAFEGADSFSGQPVYTFVNEDNGARIYTIDKEERDEIEDSMSDFEEVDERFYAYETRRTDTVPVYSFQNIETEGEFLTTSLATRDSLDDNDDFESNGVAFYAFPEIDLA